MLSLLWRNLRWRKSRFALLVLGAAVLSTGLSYLAVLADNARGAVDQSLVEHWRTSYDILVRPAGAAGSLETQHDLVEANHLSGLRGGITPAQVETIRQIPGVAVAAPVAILGHVLLPATFDLQPPAEPGLYRVTSRVTSSDGLRSFTSTQTLYQVYYPWPLTAESRAALEQTGSWKGLADLGVTPAPIFSPTNSATTGPFYYRTSFGQPVVLAAVDPTAEAALVGLDKAVVTGRFLTPSDRAEPDDKRTTKVFKVPVLLSGTPVSDLTWQADYELLVPGSVKPDTLLGQLQSGALRFDSLKGSAVPAARYDAAQLLEQMRLTLTAAAQDIRTTFATRMAAPSPLSYREAASPSANWPLAVQVVPTGKADPTYYFSGGGRQSVAETPRVAFRQPGEVVGEPIIFELVGEYDAAKLTNVGGDDLNAVPMETYRPVTGTVRFDAAGKPAAPQTLRPGDSPQDAFLTPPTLITTLDAARAVMKTDAVISAVRIRVAGSADLSEATQARVQLIADQIARATGLQVDITLGSSPRKLLMLVPGFAEIPGLGYLEQPWIQKGAQILIHREINKGNALLLLVVLVVGIVYVMATALVSVLVRRRELALMAAVGWTPRSIVGSIVAEAALSALVTAGVGMLTALAVGAAGRLYMPAERILFAGGVTALVYLIGVLGPAVLAGGTRPLQLLRQGEIGEVTGRVRVGTLLGLSVANVLARWRRNLLSLVAIGVPTALMGVLLFITIRLKGILILTLVGDAIVVQVGPTHAITLAIAFGLAIFTTADILWLNIAERRSELALLAALGWPRRMVRLAILTEGCLIGALAGVLGLAVSMGIMAVFYRTALLPLVLPALALLTVPILTGLLGAVIPAETGVRVSPSTGLRTE